MTLLAGFKTLLLARSGRNDICVATAMANRSQLRTERMIGPLENTTLIRTRIDADLSFQEALGRVRDSVLEAYARQELPFDILAAPTGGRRWSGSGIAHSGVFRPPERVSAAQAARCDGPIVRLSGRPAGPADRSHVALGDAQGDAVGHYRLMQLQERPVRSQRCPALGRGLRRDLGTSGCRSRDVARPAGRSLGELRCDTPPRN